MEEPVAWKLVTYNSFSHLQKKKEKTGGASIVFVTAPKHPLEKPCDVNDWLIAASDAYWPKWQYKFICLFDLKTSPGQRQAITWSNAGMGVTKTPFTNFSVTGNFDLAIL